MPTESSKKDPKAPKKQPKKKPVVPKAPAKKAPAKKNVKKTAKPKSKKAPTTSLGKGLIAQNLERLTEVMDEDLKELSDEHKIPSPVRGVRDSVTKALAMEDSLSEQGMELLSMCLNMMFYAGFIAGRRHGIEKAEKLSEVLDKVGEELTKQYGGADDTKKPSEDQDEDRGHSQSLVDKLLGRKQKQRSEKSEKKDSSGSLNINIED